MLFLSTVLSNNAFLNFRLYMWEYVSDKSINLWDLVKKHIDESMQVEYLVETPGDSYPPSAQTRKHS